MKWWAAILGWVNLLWQGSERGGRGRIISRLHSLLENDHLDHHPRHGVRDLDA